MYIIMNEREIQAHEYLRRKDWIRALEIFDQIIGQELINGSYINKGIINREQIINLLLGRTECNIELGHHEVVISDCRQILNLLSDSDINGNEIDRAWKRMVSSLLLLKRYNEAELAAREWLAAGGTETLHELEMLRQQHSIPINGIKAINNTPGTGRIRLDDELAFHQTEIEWTRMGFQDGPRRNRKHPVELIHDPEIITYECQTNLNNKIQNQILKPELNIHKKNDELHKLEDHYCTYCGIACRDKNELRVHCQLESHQMVIMSDEGRDWHFRAPPRGLTADAYTLCEDAGACRYGAQCVEAHSPDELAEWRERFQYRKMKLQRASEKELYGKSYTEQILERWISAPTPDSVMREKIDSVDDSCNNDLATTVSSKTSKRHWVFQLKTTFPLVAVALLQDAHRNHFTLRRISTTDSSGKVDCIPSNDQEWINGSVGGINEDQYVHSVEVAFTTDIYGTFRQSVVFDFGHEPVLVRHVCVDVVPVTDADRMKEIRKELVLATAERWDAANSDIIAFQSPVTPQVSTPAAVARDSKRAKELLEAYPSPRADTFTLTQSTLTEKKLTRNNYRARMHELLSVEEMARYEQVARYNITTRLRLATCYLLAPNGMANSTAKYTYQGELFALMNLGKDVSEDTSAGRLILNNCTTVLIAPAAGQRQKDTKGRGNKQNSKKLASTDSSQSIENIQNENKNHNKRRIVYEALIEDKGKNMIYMRLSSDTVSQLNMKPDTDFLCDVQFQLNRVPYCEWHYAIDKIADFRVIFPETYLEPSIPWTPQRQWSEIADPRLNLKQKEAIVAITTPVSWPLPPILIIGPFGTGKTYTLAQAIKQLLIQSDTRILVCTHSNSAADLYIKDYLHPYVEAGNEKARPLRIYYHKRWVATVNPLVQKYCLIDNLGAVRCFRVPTLEDVLRHRVVVVTLSISMYLSTIGLPRGHFTHILLDEAAQAMECEAIMPLALADESTRIVLAGDHMQLSPELFSHYAKERQLHVSLLERLYDLYPATFPCKILLCENYRAHEAIIHFTSELFYDQKLISSGKQPRHDKFYPLTFFTTRGEDVQDHNSTAFYNNAEVYEVVERVCELRKRWPTSWGKIDDQSIGIMTPYADQVFRIRSELRKRRMGGISVERVLNVQGKQFRAIFLSTVRTRRTCQSGPKGGDEMDYGFLSNSKLLNTAITRAQSLVAVVGDPVALCSIGRCRKVWERFIEICNAHHSLFGITWSYLRSQLDGVELKKTYTLNPLAPEFIPRQYQAESYIRLPPPAILRPPAPPAAPNQPGAPFPGGPNAPGIYPLPIYYYSPQGGPPQPQPPQGNPGIVPLRPPPGVIAPPPLIYPQQQPPPPWVGINYPLSTSTVNNSSNPQMWVKKKAPLRGSPILNKVVPNTFIRMPGSPKNTPHCPPPPQPPQLTGPPIPSPQTLLPPENPNTLKEDRIQFLHNVHFPERPPIRNDWPLLPGPHQPPPPGLQGPSTPQPLPPSQPQPPQQPQPPPQLIENPNRQIEWCNPLIDTSGVDAATKLMEFLILANQQNAQPPLIAPKQSPPLSDLIPPQLELVRNLEELFNDKTPPPPTQPPPPQLPPTLFHHPNQTILPAPGSLAWFGEKLEPKPPPPPLLMRNDLETNLLLSTLSQPPPQQGPAPQLLHPRLEPIDWPLQPPPQTQSHHPPPPQQSVPLYRRQVNIMGPQGPQPPHLGSGSGAFAGYARAAINNQQLINVNQQPHQPQQHSQPQTLNGPSQHALLNQHEWNANNFIEELDLGILRQHQHQQHQLQQNQQQQHHHHQTQQPPQQHPQQHQQQQVDEAEKSGDPLAILRALGTRASGHGNSGLYQYFS